MTTKYPDTESNSLEFKAQIPAHDRLLRTIVGFCNLYGGRLVVGVRDDRGIVGVPEETIESTMEFLHKLIFESCSPPILPEIYTRRIGNKLLLVIEIAEGMRKPYFITARGLNDGTFIRLGRSTMRAGPNIIEELRWHSRGKSADHSLIYEASADDIDLLALKDFLSGRKGGFRGRVTEDLLTGYSILSREQNRLFPTLGGILLFGKTPQQYVPEAFTIATVFKGAAGRQAKRSQDFTGDLFRQFQGVYDFIISALSVSFEISSTKRHESLEIPAVAVREALLNAFVHRSYAINGPTKVAIFDDRIEIFSPGIFPGPLTTSTLEDGMTFIRNMAISRIFREAGYVEKLGSRFRTIFQSYRDAGLEPPSVIEGEAFVKCILPRTALKTSDQSSPLQQLIGLLRENREISIAQAQSALGVSRATTGRRLRELVQQGYLKQSGKGRGARYVLKES